MSFITKRERVFHEYDLFELPARNEGKLKAYGSCTDARAWSHFCSDKSEHLAEIIKKNNVVCRTKYVPTDVIVNTLMVAKNAEIDRLKRKIVGFEQMLAAYDQLELTSEQKCEIADVHASITAANKELNELSMDLDLSGFTESIGSDTFETGKSRGDELSRSRGDESDKSHGDDWTFEKESTTMESKSNQAELRWQCDVSISVHDPRIEEMQDAIISKDAKLNAMKNTIAVMENDVCEPYCIYAHIYTALEKILAILCQNQKYKLYLTLMMGGKDTSCIDIKGKILFKLKVLEKFSIALISPCSQKISTDSQDCSCFRAEITFALTSAEAMPPNLDNRRAHLVADIIKNEEIKEILNKDSAMEKVENQQVDDLFTVENDEINSENLKRLNQLQDNYNDLMICHEALSHEKSCLQIRCQKYEELEMEYESLKTQLRDYTNLWNEKEHYRKRSVDLDTLKEQYLQLTYETSNLETRLNSELEINHMKAKMIEELQSVNISLEKKMNESFILFEKEKNTLQCKLKETECKIMCQEQQIKSLLVQIDRLLEQDQDKIHTNEITSRSLILIDELESSKDQINNLNEALLCKEQEKNNLELELKRKLDVINTLKIEIEDWKNNYEKTLQYNDYLKNSYDEGFQRLKEENLRLSQNIETKSEENNKMKNIINYKSRQIDELLVDNEKRNNIIKNLFKQLHENRVTHVNEINKIENEKKHALEIISLAKNESQELLDKVKNYTDVINKQKDLIDSLEARTENYSEMKKEHFHTMEENKFLQNDLSSQKSSNTVLFQEIQKLREDNNEVINNSNSLNYENNQYKASLELIMKKNEILENKIKHYENISQNFEDLHVAHQKIILEKTQTDNELNKKGNLLDNAIKSIEMITQENKKLNDKYEQLLIFKDKCTDLQNNYDKLLVENNILHNDFHNIKQEYNNLHNNLESKVEQNKHLYDQIKCLRNDNKLNINNLYESENNNSYTSLNALNIEKNLLENELEKIKKSHEDILIEKEDTYKKLNMKLADFKKIEQENRDLHMESKNLLTYSEDLEKALKTTRNLLMEKSTNPKELFTTLKKDIINIKQDNNKVRELLDKSEELENLIFTLKENILTRDDKISILQNYINQLEEEIRQLHNDVAEAINIGEEISNTSYEKLNQTLKKLKTYHSKETHNMEMELAKLQNEKCILEEQLSAFRLKIENSTKDISKYLSQIRHLEKERDIIITDIKQLELESVGNNSSSLSPNKCDIENILFSLHRIRTLLNEKLSKSKSIEQTLLKVQTSSQLLLREAKDIVEKEKQRIINEKEEAIHEKNNIEKKVSELKRQLEEQISNDKNIIIDLEAKLLNQKLITDKINTNSQNYISELEKKVQSFQNMYQNSVAKNSELQESVLQMTKEKSEHLEIFDRIDLELTKKCKDVLKLQETIEKLTNKNISSIAVQVILSNSKKSVTTQTNKDSQYNQNKKSFYMMESENQASKILDNNITNTLLEQKSQSINEKNNELSFNFVKSCYFKYKSQRLGPSLLEQYSISNKDLQKIKSKTPSKISLIDIYNRQSLLHTNSLNYTMDEHIKTNKISRKSNVFTVYDLSGSESNNNNNNFKNSTVTDSVSRKSIDKDLHVIYNDSESNYEESSLGSKKTWNNYSQILVKPFSTISKININFKVPSKLEQKQSNRGNENDIYLKEKENNYDGVKPTLKITMPHVETASPSVIISNYEEKLSNMYTIPINTIPKNFTYSGNSHNENMEYMAQHSLIYLNGESNKIYNEDSCKSFEIVSQKIKHYNQTKITSYKSKHQITDESHDKISQVSVEISSIKLHNDNNKIEERKTYYEIKDSPKRSLESSGFQYDLNTIQWETNVENQKMIALYKTFQKSKSDGNFYEIKTWEINNSRPLKLNNINHSSIEYKTVSCPSNSSDKSKSKSFAEQSVMAKFDYTDDYEAKIQYLSKTLKNIEKEHKNKMEVLKLQYDSQIKNIIYEHNQDVKSIQNLHEETLQDMLKMHESEVENMKTLSIEAMRKTDILVKENQILKMKIQSFSLSNYEPELQKIPTRDGKKRRKPGIDTKTLSKTNVMAFHVQPKSRSHGLCACSFDHKTLDNKEQRKMCEHANMKYIANKIINNTVEALNAQELSFLHLKVCRTWKKKLNKEETLKKKMEFLEHKLLNKQRYALQHIAELDRKVAVERRRLQEVREAVCRPPLTSHDVNPEVDLLRSPLLPPIAVEDLICNCNTVLRNSEENNRHYKADTSNLEPNKIRSAENLAPGVQNSCYRPKRTIIENNKAKLTAVECRESRNCTDELPTRLRRPREKISRR